MPIKWSTGCSLDPLACHVFSQKADDKLWCDGWFLLLKLAFYLLASDFFSNWCDSGIRNTFFSSDFIPKICFCCTFKLHLADWVWNLKCPTRYRAGEGKGLWELTGACTVNANLSEEEQWCAAFSSRLRMALLPVFSTLPSVQLKQPRVKFRVNFKVEPRTELLFSLTSTWKPEGSPPYNLWLSFLKKCLISILTSCSIGNTILFSSSSPCVFLFVEIIHLS